MNIIIVGTAHPFRGGIADYNERLAIEFQQQGHIVEIYTFTLQYPSILFPGKTQYTDSPAPLNLNIYRKVNSINPLNWWKVGREIRKKRPDLVITRFWIPFIAPSLGTIARLIRKNKFSKVIAIIDNMLPHEKRPGDKILAQYFVKSIDGIITMSHSVYKDVEMFDTVKPKLFSPHPLYDNFGEKLPKNTCCENLQLSPNDRYVLFFGIIRDYKGLDLLLRAFANKKIKALNIKLIVAGEFYNNAQDYFALEKELELSNQIIWFDSFIPSHKVKYFFGIADIVAQPYKSATQSGVTQIAYHFEKPILVTNVGGLSEIVPDGKVGYCVNPNVEEITHALIDFFTTSKEDFFHQNILIEKQKYSWESMIKSIMEVYQKIEDAKK